MECSDSEQVGLRNTLTPITSHLMLEQQWEQFVLQRDSELPPTDFDWASLSELPQSRATSEADETLTISVANI